MGGSAPPFDRVFTRICHVKRGYEDRERHIRREFTRRGVPINFFLDFDVDDIGERPRYAPPEKPARFLSLSMKHIGIWREFLASPMPYCLVFEDDVFLAKDFVPKLSACVEELGSRQAAVYLGNAGNYYISYFKLQKGQHLYPARHGRCADSYLIPRSVAEARLNWLDNNMLVTGIDSQIDIMDAAAGTEILWFERPIVEQGTHTGAFASSLSSDQRTLWQKRILWNWKKSTRRMFGKMR